MKRFCKKVDITDRTFVRSAIDACLAKRSKRLRPDTIRLFSDVGGVDRAAARRGLEDRDDFYDCMVCRIADTMVEEISSRRLNLPPVRMKDRHDGRSGKVRRLAVQEIRQLLYDHVAVMAMVELERLMGEHQVSGRKGMGMAYGHRLMHRWVTMCPSKQYFVKMDIKAYYGSVDTARLMRWLRRRVKNEPLLWLVDTLLETGEPGLNIGSYLSHFLANLYLSDTWHDAMQRIPGIKHALFYMDDFVLIGTNKRHLKIAAEEVARRIRLKGLTVKPGWQVHLCSRKHPIDIMGMRFARRVCTIRKGIFRRARRALVRFSRVLRKRARLTIPIARKVISYHGWLAPASCLAFRRRIREFTSMRRSRFFVSTLKNK